MASATVFSIFRLFFALQCCFSTAVLGASLAGARPAMVLPLFHSSPHISGTHRHLQGSDGTSRSNARLGLHDDLLRTGYYTTHLGIGTPPQKFALIVDTGSTMTYVPCSTCEQCGNHEDPKFQPELSSTYQPVQCNVDCTCDDDKNQCLYERQYAEMSTSSGVLGEDVISFGNQSELVPQRAVFGCENLETGDLYSQQADGIMGLGRGDLSIVDQLVEKGVISDSFSLCYGGMGIGGGAMVLGAISPPSGMIFAKSDPSRSPYYNVDLKEIHVAGEKLPINPTVFDGKHGTVIDSGTTYAYLPEEAFVAFKEAVMKELHSLKQVQGPDPNYNDICFSAAGSKDSELSKTFPTVDFVFGKGQKLSLSPENFLFKILHSLALDYNGLKQNGSLNCPNFFHCEVADSCCISTYGSIGNSLSASSGHTKVEDAYCLGIFQNGHDPTTLLGGIVFRNSFVMYDRANSRTGFWKTNCSELWERLHISGSQPPSHSPSQGINWTAEVAPSLAPAYHGDFMFPDEHQIGRIVFGISLSVKYSDVKPHIRELMESIAQELGVNSSQVHLLNFTSEGNNSFIEWDVVPSGSSNYISNITAFKVVYRVAEHQMQLPDQFGSYKMLHWKVEPPVNLAWWQQHVSPVGLTIIVIFILALSASGIWIFLRRRKQTLNSYKPVGSASPEQELQPL